MTAAQLIGTMATLYGFGASCTILLQARQLRERKSSCDVSARFFASYVGGYAIWLLYGLAIGSLPVIAVHAVGLACGALTLTVVLTLRGSLRRPSTWGSCKAGTTTQGDSPWPSRSPQTGSTSTSSRLAAAPTCS
jgi:MtN3 and saliva related transmembrane protein